MSYPTAPLYEYTKESQPSPFLKPRSAHGHNDGHGYASPAAKQAQDPIATKYECPLCFSYLLPPIYQCYDGHPVCNECEAKVKRCPTCHGDMPKKKRKIRSLVLEDIVVGSKFNCKNHLLGCPVKDLKYDQIKLHTSTCLFTEIPYCEQLGINCTKKCWTGNLIDHLKYEHGVIGCTFPPNSLLDVGVKQSVPDLKVKSVNCAPYYLEWENQIFIIRTGFSYEGNRCSWMVCRVGSTRSENTDVSTANDFVANIKLSSGSGDCQINSLSWRGLTGTLTTPFGYNNCTFSVPLQTLNMYTAVSKDTQGAAKSSWSIEVRLQKRNQTPSPTPLLSRMRTGTESIMKKNSLAVSTEDFLMDFRNTRVIDEIKSKIKNSPPPLPLRPPSPASAARTQSRLANFICDNQPTRIYPLLNL